ncbi:hypothetical protein [Nostoc sp. JL23]|uniref:hypothetical protein n=1 Tax=Nostoc sp. JL23 TaxID=2815394 RepID=UPI001D7D4FC0|nr:hypothetical protein [Nostoc sp. JL23]MBN3875243.1 hypothetical protein [Nostoc sp. JL23]
MSQEADDILKGRSLVNRHLYQQRIADTAEAQILPTAYIGFDAELGLAKLKDGNGNISYGSAQTNGAVGLGENIRVRRGGVISGYDSMPRVRQKPGASHSTEDLLKTAILFVFRDPATDISHFYVQVEKTATKIAEMNIGDIRNFAVDRRPMLSGIYLTAAKSRIIAHLVTRKYSPLYVSSEPVVHRYFISGKVVTEEVFTPPQSIPSLSDDWQNLRTTSYSIPEINFSDNACINFFAYDYPRSTNVYKNKIITSKFGTLVNGITPDTSIKTQDIALDIEIHSGISNENDTCNITNTKIKKTILRKLVIEEDMDLDFVYVLAFSTIYAPASKKL